MPSQADGKLLSELRQAPSDLKSSGEAVQTFATQLVRRIGESRAENIARTLYDVAKGLSLPILRVEIWESETSTATFEG